MGTSLATITSSHVSTVLVVRDPLLADRIRTSGVQLGGELSAYGRPEVVASIDELAGIHPIDLVFIATKTTAIEEVCNAVRPHLSDLPYIVSYQNGIEPGREIIARLGTPRVVRMVLRYGATIERSSSPGAPLRIHVGLHDPPHSVGGEGEALAFAEALAPAMNRMGLPMTFAADIEAEAWRKGIENAAGNPIAALVQAPLGQLLESPGRGLIEKLLDEGIDVAQAAGVDVQRAFRDAALARMTGGRAHLPSMAHDVAAGRPTEITQLNEQIVRFGRRLGVPTPTHDVVLDLIRVLDWCAHLEREATTSL